VSDDIAVYEIGAKIIGGIVAIAGIMWKFCQLCNPVSARKMIREQQELILKLESRLAERTAEIEELNRIIRVAAAREPR
jgi:hypothetical protein